MNLFIHADMPAVTAPLLQNRLAYLTNKCNSEADLDYYVMEAGHILGIRLPEDGNAKHVLSEVFRRIAEWKMVGSVGVGQADAMQGAMTPGHFDQFEL